MVADRLAIKDDSLRLEKGKETLHSALAANTGLLEATERNAVIRFEAILTTVPDCRRPATRRAWSTSFVNTAAFNP